MYLDGICMCAFTIICRSRYMYVHVLKIPRACMSFTHCCYLVLYINMHMHMHMYMYMYMYIHVGSLLVIMLAMANIKAR